MVNSPNQVSDALVIVRISAQQFLEFANRFCVLALSPEDQTKVVASAHIWTSRNFAPPSVSTWFVAAQIMAGLFEGSSVHCLSLCEPLMPIEYGSQSIEGIRKIWIIGQSLPEVILRHRCIPTQIHLWNPQGIPAIGL